MKNAYLTIQQCAYENLSHHLLLIRELAKDAEKDP